jgi:two-component system sensor histidine kinase QseC
VRGALDAAERAAALRRLEHDALRAGEVLSKVLALARASRSELAEAAQSVDVAGLARRVVAEFAQDAHQSGHELSFAGPDRLLLKGHPVLLELALRNLIENALTHTAAGTAVEVQLDADGRWLQVSDNAARAQAPAPEDKPAGRGLGLGLGHRVAEKVAALHGGQFARVDVPGGAGSAFRLSFGDAIRLHPQPSAR